MPFLSGTCALCQTGRALFGQVYLADKRIIDFNFLPAVFVLVIAALMHYDFLDKLPQQGRGKFLEAGAVSYTHLDVYKRQAGAYTFQSTKEETK